LTEELLKRKRGCQRW